MEKWLITDMPWQLTAQEMLQKLHLSEDDEEDFLPLFDQVISLVRPAFYYGRAEIAENDGLRVRIDDQWFESRVLAVNLKDCRTVYPYIMTSGRAAYDFGESQDDYLMKYWVEQICEEVLRRSGVAGMRLAAERLGIGHHNTMNPGSLKDWPISQQEPLFALFGDVTEKTGVSLKPSFLMLPVKSGSGIIYESGKHYANCMLCPRQNCPNRRAPYDPKLYEKEYAAHETEKTE